VKHYLKLLIEEYLIFVAKILIKRWKPQFIVITGSAGKTTTKNTIYTVLKDKFGNEIAESYGSMGTRIGLPIALMRIKPDWVDRNEVGPPIWQWPFWMLIVLVKAIYYCLTKYPRWWVIELTADKPGDFEILLSYIRPLVAVITNIGPAHLEFFGSIEEIAKEKGLIVERLPKDGFAVLNWHDEQLQIISRKTKAKVYWVRAKGLDFAPGAARIIGRIFGMSYQDIDQALRQINLVPHRFEVLKIGEDVTLVDSTYNANPVSTIAVLQKVVQITQNRSKQRRVIAVLGDMMELGGASVELHQKVGAEAKKMVNLVITIGDLAKAMNGDYHARNVDDVFQYLTKTIRPGDTLVIKASHGMRLDRLVDRLKERC
jgi:UDP-N-acetylmuramoyl-tripeptide--D-alanyl-D-alanine ligase